MPSRTPRQRAFFGAELARKRAGKKTKTGMSEEKLMHFAMKVRTRHNSPTQHLSSGGIRLEGDMRKAFE